MNVEKGYRHTAEELKLLQALPLELKVEKTKLRILEWVKEFGIDGVYVGFSGGKDSTVLLHIVRSMFPEIEAVFVDTGLEYPEIKQFVKQFDNVKVLYPKMNFCKVIQTHGYPVISKEVSKCVEEARIGLQRNDGSYQSRINRLFGTGYYHEYEIRNGKKSIYNLEKWKPLLNVAFNISDKCCKEMKKKPSRKFERETKKKIILGTMAEESQLRRQRWLKYGCNAFDDNKQKSSNPMSFWKEQDVLHYITKNNLAIAPPYGKIVPKEELQLSFFEDWNQCQLCTTGCKRTGCMFCGFGLHLERGETRFQRLKNTHKNIYDYCLQGGAYDSDGIWKPDKNGLGMKHVFDELNKIYGENFIRYE